MSCARGFPPHVIADPAAACLQGLQQGPQGRRLAGRAATAGVPRGGSPPPAVLPTPPPCPTRGRRHPGPVQLAAVPCLQVSAAICVCAVCILCLPHVPLPHARCSQAQPHPCAGSSPWDMVHFPVCWLPPHTASAQVAAYPSLTTCCTFSVSGLPYPWCLFTCLLHALQGLVAWAYRGWMTSVMAGQLCEGCPA